MAPLVDLVALQEGSRKCVVDCDEGVSWQGFFEVYLYALFFMPFD